jgi:tRNA 5-methylaminomethyl-2-thiouridine biosynthesis bifunctional protein
MSSVSWDGDGQPRSPLYQDIYRSRGPDGDHGLAQARHVFLQGCELLGPQAVWKHQPHWSVLENGFGLGLNFLATWQAWRLDPERPTRLHYLATEAHPVSASDLLRSSAPWPELQALTQELAQAWWGLLPGMHRLSFDSGAVVLDLMVGESLKCLPELDAQVDSVYLDGFSPRVNPAMWQSEVLRALMRLSRPGAHWATWCVAGEFTRQLSELGLAVHKRSGLPPKRACLQAICPPAPASASSPCPPPSEPIWVLGAGLAGASVARALAELGRSVRVIDAEGPAAGASGLPAGLFAMHTSADDNALSRVTRMGLRHTRARLHALDLGQDWAPTGLDEHLLGLKARRLAPDDAALCRGWHSAPVDLSEARSAWWQSRPYGWHQPQAGWLKPAALVRHLLSHPGIDTSWGWRVQALRRGPQGWQITDAQGRRIEGAASVVVAMGPASSGLLSTCGAEVLLQPVRGQLSWGKLCKPQPAHWPERPRNGDGSLLPRVPMATGEHWLVGSSFDRSTDLPTLSTHDQALNGQRWHRLSPESMDQLPDPSTWQAWAGVRATVRDRLPRVGALAPHPGLWVIAGMGARGLTLSTLCGEQLAAWITGAPSPLPRSLSQRVDAQRG